MIFITPSYRPDLDRLYYQRESIRRYCLEDVSHLVLVPKEDYALFKRKFSSDPLVEVLIQNDYVDARFYPSFWYGIIRKFFKNYSWRFSKYSGRPGWIIQQIVKLSAPDITDESVILLTDSDSIFFREFGRNDFVLESGAGVLIKRSFSGDSSPFRKHVVNSRKLLGLPDGDCGMGYMSVPMVWQRNWVVALRDYIENMYSRSWQEVLYGEKQLSEYTLYGLFVEEILAPRDISIRPKPYNFGIWNPDQVDSISDNLERIRSLAQKNSSELDFSPLCFTIQSWLGLSSAEYAKVLEAASGSIRD